MTAAGHGGAAVSGWLRWRARSGAPSEQRNNSAAENPQPYLVEGRCALASMVGDLLATLRLLGETAGFAGRRAEALGQPSLRQVVIDLMLPDGDGLDLCREIRGDSRTRHLAAADAHGAGRGRWTARRSRDRRRRLPAKPLRAARTVGAR